MRMSLKIATDFKAQEWVLQKRENDRSPLNLVECWGFQFNENERHCFFTGKFLLKPLPIYAAEAMGCQCFSSVIGEENKMLQLHMKTPTSSTSSSLACTCLTLSGNPETIGNANNGLIFMMKTTLLSPTKVIALHEKSLEWKVYLVNH
ncbi:hypothetical protein ES332_D13G288400v1 [Gossypium tomentosum]|uniref:Uncharacterized protein n=1 Tax=Gossypium tomentosum TaxID=34277 RepID=A0A5D2I2Z1_GOSTO|nr:hypothetical protein ES332_D13G288400v1 [Gossypium tomentosum]